MGKKETKAKALSKDAEPIRQRLMKNLEYVENLVKSGHNTPENKLRIAKFTAEIADIERDLSNHLKIDPKAGKHAKGDK